MKSTSGFILALIGGIVNVLMGFLLIVFGIILVLIINGISIGDKLPSMADFSTVLVILSFFLAVWFTVIGILIIVFSVKINNDVEAKKGGVLCLIFGILTLNVLSIVGGILGIFAGKKSNVSSENPFSANYNNYPIIRNQQGYPQSAV